MLTFDTNFWGAVRVLQASLPLMPTSGLLHMLVHVCCEVFVTRLWPASSVCQAHMRSALDSPDRLSLCFTHCAAASYSAPRTLKFKATLIL